MSVLPSEARTVAPVLIAALLLAANTFLARLALPHPTAVQLLEATGASKTRAYDLCARILAILPTLLRPPGRPPAPAAPVVDTGSISREVIAFLGAHPGASRTIGTRRAYSDGFRRFVLDLAERHPKVDRSAFAEAIGVPFDTLRDWITPPAPTPVEPADDAVTDARIASIVAAWKPWDGGFSAFCTFVRVELAIPYGDTLLGEILNVYGGRRTKTRPGRTPNEKARRKAMIFFHASAQWFQDGSPITIQLNDQRFTFNWELAVDGWSAALVGSSLRVEEDARAVVEAFDDGVTTTGAKPLALTTDNRAANHAPEVAEALGDTLHIRTTLGRPQHDAPVEGAFGLFQQTAPPLVVRGDSPEALARAVLAVILTVYGRATNHRPRNDRNGRSRVQLYQGEQPTPEQIAAAKAHLVERQRLQELSFRTRQARLDPVVRAMLDEVFERLGFVDPTGNVKDSIAWYPYNIVLAAIATFEGKRDAGTLPPKAAASYLLGIAKRIAERDEGRASAEHLWRRRLEAGDRVLVRLDEARRAVTGDTVDRLRTFIDRALEGDGVLLRSFWLDAAGTVILAQPREQHHALYQRAVRRIHATFRVEPRERQAAVRALAEQILPVA